MKPAKAVFCGLVVLLLLPAAPARAGEPREQLRKTVDAVIEVLKDKELQKPGNEAKRTAEIMKVVSERFDFREMAMRSLALYWRQRTEQEKEEFVSLYTDLLEHTYIAKIERYQNEKVLYGDEKVDDGYATVETRIISDMGPIPVTYRLMDNSGKWLVYDVVIEGVSLVNNYRSQFQSIIGSSSYQNLLRKMKKKVQEQKN
jgi:phospholipid transport system substrate-binding protein